jgi:excisionase family DNA binding protein
MSMVGRSSFWFMPYLPERRRKCWAVADFFSCCPSECLLTERPSDVSGINEIHWTYFGDYQGEDTEFYLENHSGIRYFLLSCFIIDPRSVVADMEPKDKWLTIVELSSYLKMSRSKLYQMAQKGKLPGSKIGTQWRFDRDRIDEWMDTLSNVTAAGSQKT